MQSKGLGDDIKKITSATRLDQIAKKIAQLLNEDCGCDDRQQWINEKTKNWPMYKNKVIYLYKKRNKNEIDKRTTFRYCKTYFNVYWWYSYSKRTC